MTSAIGRAVATALAAAAIASCSDATGTVRGGDPLFDASPPSGPSDASTTAPHGWGDLYADYFGPNGKASCTAAGICHGDASMTGAQASGFVCGSSRESCYAGMIGSGIVAPGGSSDPTQQQLWFVLRKASGGGTMPKQSSFTFSSADMARIGAWISEGAKDN